MPEELNPCPGIGQDTRVQFPVLAQRFTCGLHPEYYEILRRHEAWVREKLLPGNPEAADQILRDNLSAMFVCMSYYNLDTERVLDICNLTDWLFIHDADVARLRTTPDSSDVARQSAVDGYIGKLRGMLEGGAAPDEPWAMDSINDLITRFSAKCSTAMFGRLVEAFNYYSLETIRDEASDLLSQKITDLDSYMEMRAAGGSSATLFYHVVTEYVLGVDLDREVLDDPLVQQYWQSIMDHWYLPNDLLSFRAECARGDHNNAVCLLRRFEGLSLQEAVDKVAALIDDRQDQAVRQYAEICASPLADHPGLLPVLETFQAISAANQRWSYMAPRYHGEGFVWNGVLSGEVRLTPDHTYFPAVPITGEPTR
ncbi:terpene synthase family protein [Streptomyces sp. CB01881]|uniref:terpene synthase family protein n=1 Tax=Streptomyces sp. CB01881 TaxID=2078691 RepID=UPI000CDC333B|nr:terpene synthase family protein [Streptomyces sp. CB01881]AUY53116.1 hypothetical protein C2142_34090 [Streptomyces sp. CB01881]TYC69268.1 hypothetical protein EH183_34155 [Streptomyces sp. CB01881]